jgi:hypothetical protein
VEKLSDRDDTLPGRPHEPVKTRAVEAQRLVCRCGHGLAPSSTIALLPENPLEKLRKNTGEGPVCKCRFPVTIVVPSLSGGQLVNFSVRPKELRRGRCAEGLQKY